MTYIKPIVVALALISMTACSGSKKEQPKLDYQSQSHRLVKLEVPPDLNNPDQGNLYQLPAGSGAVRASDFNKRRTQAVQQPANAEVLKSCRPETINATQWTHLGTRFGLEAQHL